MSRALDKGVKEALKHADHGKVFSDIAGVLTRASDELLEIEFLGNSHVVKGDETVLQDGNAVAIPKLRLVQAFIFAHRIFRKHVDGDEKLPDDLVLKATAVMLLMDPEHLTAANARKRLIQRAMRSRDGDVAALLRREKLFTDSLLTGRLHRHTKSPNLWSHRRWLISQLKQSSVVFDILDDFRNIIFVSAERHPRNYYAWCHARYLISTTEPDPKTAELTRARLIPAAKQWCLGHHDDISGWMFLMVLLVEPGEAVAIIGETLKMVESFHWRNESVWYFLRNMLATEAVADAHGPEARRIKEALLQGTGADSKERKALNQVE